MVTSEERSIQIDRSIEPEAICCELGSNRTEKISPEWPTNQSLISPHYPQAKAVMNIPVSSIMGASSPLVRGTCCHG